MTESIIEKLITWNMSEYEATIYVTLVKLRKGSARDLYELTRIPRGRIYETLHILVEKGFIDCIDANPCQYRALDIRPAFEKLKKQCVLSMDSIIEDLEDIETNTASLDLPCFKLKDKWAIEKQIFSLLRRVKKQLIILCNDPEWYFKLKKPLIEASKKVDFYLIVRDPAGFANAGVRLFAGDTLVNSLIFEIMKKDNPEKNLCCLLFADDYEKIMVFYENGKETGLCSSSFLMTGFIMQSILERITPIDLK